MSDERTWTPRQGGPLLGVGGERIYAMGEVWPAAVRALANAERREDGWYYDSATAIVFFAFAVEAFINHW